MGSAFSCLRGKKVGGIELNAREISGYIHTTAGMRILNKRDFLKPSGFSTGDETVVIPRGETQLVPIRIDPIPDAPAGTKIMDMDNHEISSMVVTTAAADGTGFEGQFKVVFPASSVEGQEGTAQINLSSTVVQYEIYYARSLETDKYGNIQDYMLDTGATRS